MLISHRSYSWLLITHTVTWWFSGVYGIVLRVKILFNKKDTALVQFSDPVQAQNGNK